MTPPNTDYSIDPLRFIRDQVKDLREGKADKAVIESEFKGVQNQIKNTEDDIDDLKAQVMTEKPHSCLHEGELGEMKKSIESNKQLSQDAFKTASLASDRGFKILMGAVFGLVTFGIAFCVWAISVSHTAEEANSRVESIEQELKAKPVADAAPPQIIIASPEYLDEQIKAKEPVETGNGDAVDLEAMLERVLTKALERREFKEQFQIEQ